MARITYLIGNGFDLGLGMKTRFSDFLPVYLGSKAKNRNILRFQEEIEKNINTWADFEKQLGKHTKNFSADQIDSFLEQKEDFEEAFMDYLEKEQKKVVIDDSATRKFVKGLYWMFSVKDILREIPLGNIQRALSLKQSHNFSFINFNYTDTLSRFLKRLRDNKELMPSRKDYEDNTIQDSITENVFVHGSIGRSPIIGVNDSSQIINEDFIKNPSSRKMLIKHEFDEISQRGFEKQAKTTIIKSDIICVYGMSLGETDKQWWELLYYWMIEKERRYIVLFDWDNMYKETERRRAEKIGDLQYKMIKQILPETERNDFPDANLNILSVLHKNVFEMNLVNKEMQKLEIAVTKESDAGQKEEKNDQL